MLYALECYAGAIFRLDIAVIQSTDNLLGRCGVEALTVPAMHTAAKGPELPVRECAGSFCKVEDASSTLLDTEWFHLGTITAVTVETRAYRQLPTGFRRLHPDRGKLRRLQKFCEPVTKRWLVRRFGCAPWMARHLLKLTEGTA